MIISASRRTDIPRYFSAWFFRRLQEGFVLVRNPMNPRCISRISLDPAVVDGLVLWTKDPTPMLGGLAALDPYAYYFQFTLTAYGPDVEPRLYPKAEGVIPAFRRLADRIGPDRVIWRYDPIFLSARYSADFHRRSFESLARHDPAGALLTGTVGPEDRVTERRMTSCRQTQLSFL